MKRLGVFLLPPGWDMMLHVVHRRVTPSTKFAGTHLHTWVDRGTMRVKCLAQEHNTMSPARARTRSARSGAEHANHEAYNLLSPKSTLTASALYNKYIIMIKLLQQVLINNLSSLQSFSKINWANKESNPLAS